MNIFQLTQGQLEIQDALTNQELKEEELKEIIDFKNEVADKQYFEKIESYAYIIKKFESTANEAKEEINRISSIKKINENGAERLKEILKNSMIATDTKKAEFATIKLSLRQNPDKLGIIDEAKVPENFIKIEKKIMKLEINREYKGKENLPEWLEKIEGQKCYAYKISIALRRPELKMRVSLIRGKNE